MLTTLKKYENREEAIEASNLPSLFEGYELAYWMKFLDDNFLGGTSGPYYVSDSGRFFYVFRDSESPIAGRRIPGSYFNEVTGPYSIIISNSPFFLATIRPVANFPEERVSLYIGESQLPNTYENLVFSERSGILLSNVNPFSFPYYTRDPETI